MKSHVSLEQHVCIVCGHVYDTGNILLHKRLKQTLDRNTITDFGLCPEHKRLHDEGFVALVEVKNQPSSLRDADRTGQIAHVRRSVWPKMFDVPVPTGPIAFVELEVIPKLQEQSSGPQPS